MAKLKKAYPRPDIMVKIRDLLDLMSQGKYNKEKGKRKYYTMQEACDIVGVHRQGFLYHLRRYPKLRKAYEEIRENRLENIKDNAEDILDQAMARKGDFQKMEAKDISRLALDVLKQTDKNYSNKVDLKTETEINLSESTEDILRKIKELENYG